MTDIVERLRDPDFFAKTGTREELVEAAEEIERLRAALEFAGDRMDGIGLSR